MDENSSNKEEILKSNLELLKSFGYTHAYTGELGDLRQKSYISFSDVIDKMSEIRQELHELEIRSELENLNKVFTIKCKEYYTLLKTVSDVDNPVLNEDLEKKDKNLKLLGDNIKKLEDKLENIANLKIEKIINKK